MSNLLLIMLQCLSACRIVSTSAVACSINFQGGLITHSRQPTSPGKFVTIVLSWSVTEQMGASTAAANEAPKSTGVRSVRGVQIK